MESCSRHPARPWPFSIRQFRFQDCNESCPYHDYMSQAILPQSKESERCPLSCTRPDKEPISHAGRTGGHSIVSPNTQTIRWRVIRQPGRNQSARIHRIFLETKARCPHAAIFLPSGYCPEDFLEVLRHIGMDGFLPLPYDEGSLVKGITGLWSRPTIPPERNSSCLSS
jgi:hypothetical protein